ncbi:MAG TPA: HAMP domain-containing protein [Thermoanaerobaculia bacterium]|nr:HAMP domain-containing protein [Thermoanaerobaculia bacterium]
MKPLSFRARLASTMGALILLIAAAISIYVPRKLEQEAIALITHKADTLMQLTAFTIHPALYFQDRAALEEALSAARNDKDVAYVVVADGEGRMLAAFHRERATEAALARRVPGGGVSHDRALYEAMTPIREGSRVLARLHVGISLVRLNAQVAQMRIAIAGWSAFILTAGLIAVVLISNILTRPLRHVAAGAARIAAGQFGQRVPAGRDDEIGQLAASFNEMAANVAERDASLRESREQLRRMSTRLLTVQEQERVRIAREVHDELGQALTAMKIDLQQIARRHATLEEPLVPVAHTIDSIVDLVRRIARDLRPAILDDLGIGAALEQQLRRLRESSGIRTSLTVSDEPELDMLTGATLYRITREALANVVRHAGASQVEVSLETRDGAAVLEIRDNGRGITREEVSGPRSLGLLGIRERAELLGGSMVIEGRSGEGTVLTVTLPVTLPTTLSITLPGTKGGDA